MYVYICTEGNEILQKAIKAKELVCTLPRLEQGSEVSVDCVTVALPDSLHTAGLIKSNYLALCFQLAAPIL